MKSFPEKVLPMLIFKLFVPESLRNRVLYLPFFHLIENNPVSLKSMTRCCTIIIGSYGKWRMRKDNQMRELRKKRKPTSRQVKDNILCSKLLTRVCHHWYTRSLPWRAEGNSMFLQSPIVVLYRHAFLPQVRRYPSNDQTYLKTIATIHSAIPSSFYGYLNAVSMQIFFVPSKNYLDWETLQPLSKEYKDR